MRSPIKMLQDWSQVKKLKAGFLAALQRTPVGNGITITSPHDPVVARALIELLNENAGTIDMIDYGIEVSLIRTQGAVKSVGAQQHEHLKKHFDILDADGLAQLKLSRGHTLPERQFRDGVPDDFNGEPVFPQRGGTRAPAAGGLVDAQGRPIGSKP
jgi:hypothetical protein